MPRRLRKNEFTNHINNFRKHGVEVELEPEVINDAVGELQENGFVWVYNLLGTAPYSFKQVEPTYVLYKELAATTFKYDPEEDIRVVAATVASTDGISGGDLAKQTGLSPGRVNRAVDYLEEYGLVDVLKAIGTFPFHFSDVEANGRTRQFVASAQ